MVPFVLSAAASQWVLEVSVTILLVALLVAREAISAFTTAGAQDDERVRAAQRLARPINLALLPLLVIFALLITVKAIALF